MREIIIQLDRNISSPQPGKWNITLSRMGLPSPAEGGISPEEQNRRWHLLDDEFAMQKRLLYNTRYLNGFECHHWERRKTWIE